MRITPRRSLTLDSIHLPNTAKPLTLPWVEPGTFRMGDPGMYQDGGAPFDMVLTQGFWMGYYLITQAQWKTVMQTNPSFFQDDNHNRPVEQVSWDDAMAFCARLNQWFHPTLPVGYRFSLPTEAQWEYVCHAGTDTLYYHGNDETTLHQIAWCEENSHDTTHPVGMKAPNPWGFYNMLGNVMEWCFDQARTGAAIYPTGITVDWVGTSDTLYDYHIIRGGAYKTPRSSVAFWCSGSSDPGVAYHDTRRPWVGFRLCLRVVEQSG